MNIVPPTPIVEGPEKDLQVVQRHIDAGIRHLGSAASEFNAAYDAIWAGNDDDIVSRFNLMGVDNAIALLTRHNSLAHIVNAAIQERNAILEAAGYPPITLQQMPTVPKRPLRFPDDDHPGTFWIDTSEDEPLPSDGEPTEEDPIEEDPNEEDPIEEEPPVEEEPLEDEPLEEEDPIEEEPQE